jgi:anti-anti-sigma regulatory factor
MEAVPQANLQQSAPAGDAAAAPKLSIEKFADAGVTCLKFTGTIDEGFDGKKIARTVSGETLVLDLGGVKKISSFGIREWVDFIGVATKQVKQTVLIECAPKVVDQLNMVANFAGSGRVYSFYAPFRCDYCDSEHRVLLDVAKDYEACKAMKLAERPCPSCKEAMYFDEDGSTYFSYILGQGQFELGDDIINFLAAKLDYRVGRIDAKVKVDKIIDGRITYLRLAGDLDNTFPRDKLAEGLEGTVIVDVGGVPRVEPAGAAEWRSFVTAVTPIVEQLYLVGVQPAFLEKLCSKEDLGAKATVVNMSLPYTCGSCGTSQQQQIDVAEHHDVLKFATAPEMRCPSCKAAMQCSASEATMTVLPGLPKPVIAKDIALKIAELRARKLEKKPTVGITPLARGESQIQPRSKLVPILLGAVLLVGGAAGVLAYQRMGKKQEPGPYGFGPVVQASAKARPAWIAAGAAPGAASCTHEADNGLICTGVSLALASQSEAEDEASDAAYEALAFELAGAGQPNAWLTSVAPTILETRGATLAAYARDTLSTQARREMHDGRRAVARVISKVAPQISGRYWEAFGGDDGKKYVAFAQLAVSSTELDKLKTDYQHEAKALGATVVDYYPELGWRYGKLDHGAVVTKLEHGPLQDLGLAEHYVVLAVDGRDVVDADSFAKIVSEEQAQVAERGGAFRLLVQTDSGDPREFSTTYEGVHVDVPNPPSHGHGSHGTSSTGGVNIWDRFGGSRGSGRDDPTQ